LSLSLLTFEEGVTDILKIKPESKVPKAKSKTVGKANLKSKKLDDR
jgi:hypothetical protein